MLSDFEMKRYPAGLKLLYLNVRQYGSSWPSTKQKIHWEFVEFLSRPSDHPEFCLHEALVKRFVLK